MEKWLLVVYTNCADPAREGEFNRWYDDTHLPDVLEVPGFARATRYVNPSPAQGEARFLALYEIETEDIDKTMASLQAHMDKKRGQGRMSELTVLASRGVYRHLRGREASS